MAKVEGQNGEGWQRVESGGDNREGRKWGRVLQEIRTNFMSVELKWSETLSLKCKLKIVCFVQVSSVGVRMNSVLMYSTTLLFLELFYWHILGVSMHLANVVGCHVI